MPNNNKKSVACIYYLLSVLRKNRNTEIVEYAKNDAYECSSRLGWFIPTYK